MGWAIALHGGAGDISVTLPLDRRLPREEALRHCLQVGVEALKSHKHPLDVVELVGVETVDCNHFITQENVERLRQAKEANRVQIDFSQPIQKQEKSEDPSADGDSQIGTVGCVAVDKDGNLASATSTGGLVNKMVGRIGDTPLIGAGTYANHLCAVSATGRGEAIISATVARDVAALIEYKGLSLEEAATYVVHECVPKGNVGLVAVSSTGEVTMPFNTTGMFRACATEEGHSEIGIWLPLRE